MTKRFGFTLAEVLITLGIIGVVAAMTIPTLISNTNGAKFRSQFKKTLSTLNQAGLMSQAQYDFDYAGTTQACNAGATERPDSDMSFCAILNGTLTGQTYMGDLSNIKRNNNGTQEDYAVVKPANFGSALKFAEGKHTPTGYLSYVLADGSIVAFKSGASGCELPIGIQLTATQLDKGGVLENCIGFIDVNGATLPNREVNCGSGTTGTATLNVQTPCAVKNDANHMTDIFPIVFHDATVEPASDAAKYVLTTSK